MQPSTCHLQGSHPARGTTTDPSMWGAKGQGSTKPLVTAQIRQWGGGGAEFEVMPLRAADKIPKFFRNFKYVQQ